MKLDQVINKNQIFLDVDIENKEELFNFAVDQLFELNLISSKNNFLKSLYNREALSPTGMGDSWAIPHGQDDSVKDASVLYIRTKKNIKYESLENDSADKFFFIAVPSSKASNHVKILSNIATLLMEDDFKNKMNESKDKEEIINLIKKYSSKNSEIQDEKTQNESTKVKKVVAITACTTGIAHTYMAEKALKQAAEELNIEIFIEKQGAAGIEDELTNKQIEEADVVVLAIEKGINENRFVGKDILKVSPGKAIKEGNKVLLDALEKKSTYKKNIVDNNDSQTNDKDKNESKSPYQHLLAGVSFMIPVVVSGGLAIALSFAFGINAFENEGSLAWALFEIGAGSAMALMFPVLAGFIAYDIADKPGFAPGIIGGLIAHNTESGFLGAIIAGYLAGYVALYINKKVKFPESIRGLKNIVVLPLVTTLVVGLFLIYIVASPVVAMQGVVAEFLDTLSTNNAGIIILSLAFSIFYFDLGGPISKMVYSFAVALLSEQIYSPMAAVMIIGMIPPLSMGIATIMRPRMFKKDEREAGKTATLLGMSFITEGAIPFAIAHPKQAIPSFMLGGFVGSVISLAFNVGVTAPHGGLFLVLIPNAINNPLIFLLALAVGSTVSAISMVTLMKFSPNKKQSKEKSLKPFKA